ncbi:MAG: toll/interleukin-1 receptor domain-containing protein [Lachnospiraceae bacterium]|nr:toll/interleukin-1 receptor domain-containing protein [Lachnospiraceae bacterium]
MVVNSGDYLDSNTQRGDKMWDVFISHASEDKDDFVRPLAESLQKCGVKVWYDEFELKMGDSLTESINRGLMKSRYGIIVCSQKFFGKKWSDYEFKSLLMRQIDSERVILPIWHNVSKEFIREQSLYLMDIKALSSDIPKEELIDGILQIVRPDIINSNLMLKMGAEIHKQRANMKAEKIPLNQISLSPVRHKSMPVHLIIASCLISEVFWDALPMKYEDMVTDFARDLDYDHEFVIWSAMANSYVTFIRETKCNPDDTDKKKEIFSLLLDYTSEGQLHEINKLVYINEREYYYLVKLFIDNYKHIMQMIKKYNE